jgi:translation initiation factor IF-3
VKPRRRRRLPIERPNAPRIFARVNEEIDAPFVRLIGRTGEQLDVRPIADALAHADAEELDLVEVAATADPPVCRVMDYGKWRYEEERKARENRRNQVHVSHKEVRLRPKIGTHDYEWKKDRAVDFLRERSKVRLVVLFRGREREHPDRGRDLLDRLAADVAEFGQPEGAAVFEGRSMTMVLAPKAQRP